MTNIYKLNNIADLLDECGGAVAISKECTDAGLPITADAVYKWKKNGIQDRYWHIVTRLSGVEPNDIYEVNSKARDQNKKTNDDVHSIV